MSKLSNQLPLFVIVVILSISLFHTNSYASSYGELLPCQEYVNSSKKQKCLEKTKKRLESQLYSARKNGDDKEYSQLLDTLNDTYWEFWKVCTHWWS